MELSLQYIGLKLYAMIEAVLDLTARPIEEREVRAAKPLNFAASGRAREPHAPSRCPTAERVRRRVAARAASIFQAISSPCSPPQPQQGSGLRLQIRSQAHHFPDRVVFSRL